MTEPSSVGDGDTADPGNGDEAIVEQISADAAFELLGNETRLDVLRALFDADGPLPFSELQDVVGLRDSGRFNYHLEKLLAVFVRKSDRGYELTAEGRDVVGSILAGAYTKTVEADPIPVDATCWSCHGSLAGMFADDHVRIACMDCDRTIISLAIPPGAFEQYERAEWPIVAEQWTRRKFETMRNGFCLVCDGPTGRRLETDPEGLQDEFDVGVRYTCERCGEELFSNAEASVIGHPAVTAFHYQRGVDLTETPMWDLDWAVRPTAEVVSTEPLRVAVPVEHDGDRLLLTLDERATVVEERRA